MNNQSSLLSFFDKCYIINLPERGDRHQQMEVELIKLGLPKSSSQVQFFSAIKPTDKGEFPSIGARGCFLSHLAVLKQAQKEQVNNLLIMEDDLSFTRLLVEKQAQIVADLQNLQWDFVYLGHALKFNPNQPLFFTEISHSQPLMLAHFLCLNHQTIGELVNFLEQILQRPGGHPEGGPMHVDGAYSTFRNNHPDKTTLIANPSLGFQRSSPSNIAGYKWFDNLPIFSRFANNIRQVKNWQKSKFY